MWDAVVRWVIELDKGVFIQAENIPENLPFDFRRLRHGEEIDLYVPSSARSRLRRTAMTSPDTAAMPSAAALAAKARHRRDRLLRFLLCLGPPYSISVFMIVPYLLIVVFSFWQVEGYVIVRDFTLANYGRILRQPTLLGYRSEVPTDRLHRDE